MWTQYDKNMKRQYHTVWPAAFRRLTLLTSSSIFKLGWPSIHFARDPTQPLCTNFRRFCSCLLTFLMLFACLTSCTCTCINKGLELAPASTKGGTKGTLQLSLHAIRDNTLLRSLEVSSLSAACKWQELWVKHDIWQGEICWETFYYIACFCFAGTLEVWHLSPLPTASAQTYFRLFWTIRRVSIRMPLHVQCKSCLLQCNRAQLFSSWITLL